MTPTEAAWVAGIIDGEGCVSINKSCKSKSKTKPQYTHFSLRLRVTMVHKPTILRLQELCGGIVYCPKLQKASYRVAWGWCLSGSAVTPVLDAIAPYSVTKREEIAFGLMVRTRPRGKNWNYDITDDEKEFRVLLYQALRDEKRKEWVQ